jgi:hypothetical protein
MDSLLPNDVLLLLLSFAGIKPTFKCVPACRPNFHKFCSDFPPECRILLTCNKYVSGEILHQLRELTVEFEEPKYRNEILQKNVRFMQGLVANASKFTSVDRITWISPPYFLHENAILSPGQLPPPPAEIRVLERPFLGSLAQQARRIKVFQPGVPPYYNSMAAIFKTYDPSKIEALDVYCTDLNFPMKSEHHPRLRDLRVLMLPALSGFPLDCMIRFVNHLERFEIGFHAPHDNQDGATTKVIEIVRQIVAGNPSLRTIVLHPSEQRYYNSCSQGCMMRFLQSVAPDGVDPATMPSVVERRFGWPINQIRFAGDTVWECIYVRNIALAMDFDIEPCGYLFQQCFPTGATNLSAFEALLRFYAVLMQPGNVQITFRDYLAWIESTFFDPLRDDDVLFDENLLLSALVLLGMRIVHFPGEERSAPVVQGIHLCQKLFSVARKPHKYLLLPPDDRATRYCTNQLDPLFAAVLRCVPLCSPEADQVPLSARMLRELQRSFQAYPHRIYMIISDVNFNPRATTAFHGHTLASWLCSSALEQRNQEDGVSGVLVHGAIIALGCCAAAGCTIDLNLMAPISPQMFACLMDSPPSVVSMASVFNRVDSFLGGEYLKEAMQGSRIANLKSLFQQHAAIWHTEASLETTLKSLNESMWTCVLWHATGPEASPGDLRASVLNLIDAFERVPRFVEQFMAGQGDYLVQTNAASVRVSLVNMLRGSNMGRRGNCISM